MILVQSEADVPTAGGSQASVIQPSHVVSYRFSLGGKSCLAHGPSISRKEGSGNKVTPIDTFLSIFIDIFQKPCNSA